MDHVAPNSSVLLSQALLSTLAVYWRKVAPLQIFHILKATSRFCLNVHLGELMSFTLMDVSVVRFYNI